MSRKTACNLMAALLMAPPKFTAKMLADMTGITEGTVREWVAELHKAGALRLVGRQPPAKGVRGIHAYLYSLASTPPASPTLDKHGDVGVDDGPVSLQGSALVDDVVPAGAELPSLAVAAGARVNANDGQRWPTIWPHNWFANNLSGRTSDQHRS